MHDTAREIGETAARDTYFALFLEVSILHQLSTALLEARLPQGLLAPQFGVLTHLVRVGDGATPLDLARAFQVPKTTMTHTLAVLERLSLVRLAPNPKDGRSKQVWIAEEGRALLGRVIADTAPDMAALDAAYPAERLERVVPVLAELRRVMDAMRG
jgi:DNA-binding MarR family transcriptional regulator